MKTSLVFVVALAILMLPKTAGEQSRQPYAKCFESYSVTPSNCYGEITYYFYNAVTDKCIPFSYGGCGNLSLNNFPTFDACEYACRPNALP